MFEFEFKFKVIFIGSSVDISVRLVGRLSEVRLGSVRLYYIILYYIILYYIRFDSFGFSSGLEWC